MTTATTPSTASTASSLIEDSIPSPLPHSPLTSFRAYTEALQHSTTHLDDLLKDLSLSKEETEQLLASNAHASHRQLRTQLLTQQLQLLAQDHAQHALHTLLKLTDSHHPATARLAATQLLAYAGLPPPPHPPPPKARRLHPARPPPQPPTQSKIKNQKSKIPSVTLSPCPPLTPSLPSPPSPSVLCCAF